MKKGFKIALIVLLILLGLLMVIFALISSGKFFDGYYLGYEVNEDNETCTVTKCVSFGANEMIVPDMIGRYRVTEIGSYAFANRQNLTSISLPKGLMKIGMGAFYECNRLSEITIPNSVTSIGSYAFYRCSALTNITLSENIAEIGARVFEGCTALTTATIPTSAIQTLPAANIISLTVNGGSSIGKNAFSNFKKMTAITIAPCVETIDNAAFRGCENITNATIPAWAGSAIPPKSLTCVVINSGTHIEERAFQNCGNLISITLPQSLVSIGTAAFIYSYRLVEVYNLSSIEITKGSFDNGCVGQYALNIYTSTEEKSKTWIDDDGYLFYEDGDICYLLGFVGSATELTLPKDCHGKNYIIREKAFYMGGRITSITFPESVVGIEHFAFAHCLDLTEITFPDSLVSIGRDAFLECEKLEQISFGKKLATIAPLAFDECYKLERIYFRGTTEEWQQVEQGEYWCYYTPAQEVVCIDGSVSLK